MGAAADAVDTGSPRVSVLWVSVLWVSVLWVSVLWVSVLFDSGTAGERPMLVRSPAVVLRLIRSHDDQAA
jgi:hypothetical protein